MSAKRREALHFTVDPDGFTERVREFWTEGRTGFSLNLLVDGMGMTLDQALSVAMGQKKLASEDGTNFALVDDNTKITPAIQVHNMVELLNRLDKLEQESKKLSEINRFRSIIYASSSSRVAKRGPWSGRKIVGTPVGWIPPHYVVDFLATHLGEPSTEEWNEFWEEFGDEIRDEMDEVGGTLLNLNPGESVAQARAAGVGPAKPRKSEAEYDEELANQWSKDTCTNVDIYLAHQRQLERMPKPKPESSLKSEDGWIIPDGKFYPCRYMEHIWLADKIAGVEEKDAEKRGWIKISNAIGMGLHIYKGDREPTQRQLNTLFDWCEKHKHPLPAWAGGKDL